MSKAKSDLLEASKTMDDMKLTLSKQEQMIKIEIDKNNELNKSLGIIIIIMTITIIILIIITRCFKGTISNSK